VCKVLMLAGVVMTVTAQPAAALEFDFIDGSYLYIPNGLILSCVLVFIAVVVVGIGTNSSSKSADDASATDLTRQYDDEAAQYRAMSRKLDAETDLAESLIKAKRTRAELDDVEEFFRDDKRRRQR
jgi:hypothetical protein